MKKLLEYRTAKNLNQRQMADFLGFSPVTYHEWEKGKKKMGREAALVISEKTGLSRDYLIFGD
jgi:transcriptional regulator with XRE-family HTH domain